MGSYVIWTEELISWRRSLEAAARLSFITKAEFAERMDLLCFMGLVRRRG